MFSKLLHEPGFQKLPSSQVFPAKVPRQNVKGENVTRPLAKKSMNPREIL